MKKALLIMALISTSFVFSQDKGYLVVAFGTSTPLGDFAGKNINNNSSGFANQGVAFDLSFGRKLSKYFGIAALVREQINSVDAQAIADGFSKQQPTYSNSVNITGWTLGGYMLGGYGSFPINDKMSIDTKIICGFLAAQSPSITVNLNDGVNSLWVKQHSASSTAFAYLFGVGYRFNPAKHFCLSANFDYLGANPQFSGVVTTDNSGGRSVDTWSQKFGTINYTIGIGYRFFKS